VNSTGAEHPSNRLIRPILILLLVCGAIGLVVVAVRRAQADRRARFAHSLEFTKLGRFG
jgi:hypothetical protein